ncbi:hypothetical protein GCM10020331_048690 [Ectobacillus funiculus]
MLNENGINASAFYRSAGRFLSQMMIFTNAKIIEMKCDRLLKTLREFDVVVVTGFQGQTKTGDPTTLGRGGSDTSASALGVALQVEYIDIFLQM